MKTILEERVTDCDKKFNIAKNISFYSALPGLIATAVCAIPRIVFKDNSPIIPYEGTVLLPVIMASTAVMVPSFITGLYYSMKKRMITHTKPNYFL